MYLSRGSVNWETYSIVVFVNLNDKMKASVLYNADRLTGHGVDAAGPARRPEDAGKPGAFHLLLPSLLLGLDALLFITDIRHY